MSVAFPDWVAVLERRPPIIGPCHLEYAGGPLDSLDSETLAKAPPAVEILYELADRDEEGCLLGRCEAVEILTEAGEP